MNLIWQDLQFGARMLRQQPGYSLVAILTLALGIGANTAIFSIVNGVLLTPLPYPQPAQLVMLWERNPAKGMEQEMVTPPDLTDWQAAQAVFSHFAYWSGENEFNLVQADGSEKIRALYVSASFFPALGVQPLKGRTFLPEEDQREGNRVAVISYDCWQRRLGGNENALGQTITLDTYGKRVYSVVGVMPRGFQFPNQADVWLPAGWNGLPRDRRGGHWLTVLARLKDGVPLARAQAEMNTIQARLEAQYASHNVGSQVAVVPLLEQTVGRNLTKGLWVLWGVIAAVLLIACANVANLTLARATARQKEIVIHLAVGASRWQVVRQLLLESLLLAIVGAVLGVLLARGGLAVLQTISGEQVPRLQTVRLDGRALLFTLVVSVLTTVLCGLAPAMATTKHDLQSALKEGSRSASAGLHRNRLRSGLVIAEVGLSLLLLLGAGLMLNSFARLLRLNRGFQAEHLLVTKLDFSVSGFTTWVQATPTRPQVALQELMQRLQTQPGVQSVAAVSALPRGSTPPRQGIILEQGQPQETPRVDYRGVTPAYFRTMGIVLLQGREFTEHDVFGAPGVAIINETFVKRWFPNTNPIGQRIAMEGRTPGQPVTPAPWEKSVWSEIVGVVADVKKLNLTADTVPEVYTSYWQYPMQSPELLVRTTAPTTPAAIQQEIRALHRNIPAPRIETMDALLSDVIATPRLQTLLLALFGALALLLASIGLYGVLAYTVAQRTPEIGIRLALGATARDVLLLIVGQGLRLVGIGVGIGLLSAWWLMRLLQSLLFEVRATDPWTYAAVVLVLVAITGLACYGAARRATQVDPLVALRAE
ncbi:MAG: ABC transporter permease [Blastocatellia bacterium]